MHFPEKKDNEYGAWAWKFDLKDGTQRVSQGLLEGRTVAMKDNIAVKDVPMLMGSDFVKGFVPVSSWVAKK